MFLNRFRFMVLFLGVSLLPLAGYGQDKSSQPDSKKEFTLSKEEQAILELTNKEREKEKLPPLKASEKLFKAARGHSENMAKQSKMAHELDGKNAADRVKEVDYRFRSLGENVAYGQRTPEEVMKTWMNSEHHRTNILRQQFTEIGIGVARNDKGVPYYTQVFGRPRNAQ